MLHILVKDINNLQFYLQSYVLWDGESYNEEFELNNGSYISKEAKIDPSTIIGKNCFIGKVYKLALIQKLKIMLLLKIQLLDLML